MARQTEPARQHSSGERSRLAILVVDDDDTMRSSIRRILTLDGYDVQVAGSISELRAKSTLAEFFAILLDRKLPDGDAISALPDLRQRAPDAAILMVTGHADVDSTLAAIRQGVHDYLIKPIEPETLRSRLRSLAELYHVRRELQQSEEQMLFLVEHLPAGAVYVDDGRLLANRAVQKYTGYENDELRTLDQWFDILCADRAAECRERYLQTRAANFPTTCRLPIVRKDGVRRVLEIAGYCYGHHEVWLVIDVTELQDAQSRLVQSERLAAIGEMVTGLAHESRNALQRARGCLDLLELDLDGNREQLDLTHRIRRALNDLQRNYEEVRSYAAPFVLDLSDVDAAAVLRESFNDLTCEFHGTGHVLRIDADPRAGTVRADPHRLAQVFRNILENAIAASPGAAEIDVRIEKVQRERQPFQAIEIQDRGKGMNPETVTRLFEPFYTTKQSGTGLGMAICKRIVTAHGGSISARSILDQGATIRILLPCQRAETA